MRTKTLASLLILCGSTAALAQVANPLQDTTTQNTTVNNTAEAEPPANTTEPANTTAPDNTTDDAPPN